MSAETEPNFKKNKNPQTEMICFCFDRFLALTPWRVYHLIAVSILGRVIMQIIKDMVLSRKRGKKAQNSL